MMAETATVWDRQKGESRKAYAAFVAYRDLGVARSQAKVATQLGKSETLVARWSSKWQWVVRTDSFDRWQEEEVRKERMADVKDALKQHTQMSRNLAVRTYNALVQLFDVDQNGAVTSTLNSTDLVRLNIAMVDLWRKSLGIPDRVQGEMLVHHDGAVETGQVIDGQILADPVAREAAFTLIERLAGQTPAIDVEAAEST
jgi:antitoxin component of MazEF toxin-antitoxin module/transposase